LHRAAKKSGSVNTPSDFGLGNEIGHRELERFLMSPLEVNQEKNRLKEYTA
jgi:hypothetical protein